MPKITKTNELKIGLWATQCCHRDLHEITEEDEITEIIDDWDEGISYDVYTSRKEALLDIRKCFSPGLERDMIDIMLSDRKPGRSNY